MCVDVIDLLGKVRHSQLNMWDVLSHRPLGDILRICRFVVDA